MFKNLGFVNKRWNIYQSVYQCIRHTSLASNRQKISKFLVANRGEIAIRVIRAGNELALKTVAVYGTEDRFSMHRGKASESYEITGYSASPVRAYLDQDEIIRIAKHSGLPQCARCSSCGEERDGENSVIQD